MKKWECTICGYIHEGDEPPDSCPICGAGPEYFKEIVEEAEAATVQTEPPPPEPAAAGTVREKSETSAEPSGGIAALVLKLHLHPIMAHTPNGVLPVALVFLVLAILFDLAGFEQASFYNLVFVLLAMPLVIATGYLEWQNRYKGLRSKMFFLKIGASIVVSLCLIAMIVWRVVDPQVAASANRWIYLSIGAVMIGAVGVAGHIGGKLVFGGRDR